MRKTLIVLGCMSLGLAHAQQGREHTQHNGATKRVGINTEKPVATLELSKVSGVPTTQVQGFLLPHLDQAERNAMEKEAFTNGLMIFNTTKNCIDWWDGVHWQCTDGSYQDEHGDEYAKYKATFSYTATQEFTKNDCPAGQIGSKVSYTPATPIVGSGISKISEEDAKQKAEANAKAEFERLGQQEANTNGTCRNMITLHKCTETYQGKIAVVRGNGRRSSTGGEVVAILNSPLSDSDRAYILNLPDGYYAYGGGVKTIHSDAVYKSVKFGNQTFGFYDSYWIFSPTLAAYAAERGYIGTVQGGSASQWDETERFDAKGWECGDAFEIGDLTKLPIQ